MHACRQDTLNGAGITLADGNTIGFIRIQGPPGDAIFGNGVNGATISNCEIANTTNNGSGIADDSATGNWTISGNSITGVNSIGITLTGDTGDNLVARITNNTITNSQAGAIGMTAGSNSTVRAQITGNTMTGTAVPGATLELISANTANFCTDIVNNTNDDAYCFARVGSPAVLEVEQLSQLISINNNSGVVDNNSGGGLFPATEVADGTCGF